MYITGLKKERKRLSVVFVDDAFWAKVDNEILVRNSVKVGTLVDNEFLSKLKFDSAVVRMEELGFVNDEVFAKKYAKELLFNKHFSKRRAEFELSQKGIDKDTIYEVLSDLECDSVEQIQILVDKKYKTAYYDEKIKKRAVAFLQRHGYSWDDIKQVLGS